MDLSVLEDISQYLGENFKRPVWSTNHAWHQGLVKGGGQVATLRLEEFDEVLKQQYIRFDSKFEDLSFQSRFYIWHRGSHITWHTDKRYSFGSTIYLNKEWDKNDGGLYLWQDDDHQIHAEVPEFNKMVLNSQGTHHAVSMISNQAREMRTTLQIWIT